MTIQSSTRKAGPYSGTGAQVAYPFAYKVFAASDVLVVRTDTGGVEHTLTLNSDYGVALNSDQNANPGGTVTMGTAPATGELLTLGSRVPATQLQSIPNQGGFYPKVIEDGLDKATIESQQLAETLGRTLRFPFSDAGAPAPLPTSTLRAGKLLGFDSSGQPVAVPVSSGGGTTGVESFNGRYGVVSLLNSDVDAALGYTPVAPADLTGIIISAKSAPFNAVGDGVADDTAALQAFADYLGLTGARGHIPAGKYRITNQINFTNTAYVYGDGWKEIRDMTGPTTRDWSQAQIVGTIIYADFTSATAAAAFYITGNSVTITDMEFEALQPLPGPGWTSNATPYAISLFRPRYYEQGGNGVLLENIMLRNFKDGIHANGCSSGILRGITGQCFGIGIFVSRNYGSLRVEDVNLGGTVFSGVADVMNYMAANATGISLGRVDNPSLSNIFTFGVNTGLHTFVDTSLEEGGATERLQGTNFGFDNVKYGMLLHDSVTADISNFYVYCRNDTDSRGIHSTAYLGGGYTPIRLNLSNGDFQGSMAEACRFEVAGNINMTNIRIRDYNNSGGSFPGIAVYDGVHLQYKNLVGETSNVAPLTFANGTGTIAGDGGGGGSGYAPLSGANFTGPVDNTSWFRSTGRTTITSGKGLEMSYSTSLDAAFVIAYDHATAAYKDINLGGNTITFQGNAGNVGSFDNSGYLLLGYSTSNGAYKLQVNGAAMFAGAVTGVTASPGDNSTKLATTAFVAAAMTGAGSGDFASTVRSTAQTTPASGAGVEVMYSTSLTAGFVQAYDRTGAVYKDMNIGGRTITFKAGTAGANAGSFDPSGYLLLGYTTSVGGYLLQVNGTATFSGAVYGPTAAPGTNTTQLATTAFVAAAVAGGGGTPDFATTIRSTGKTNPTSGAGVEIDYDSTLVAGVVQAYDRTGSAYKDIILAGSTVTFKSGAAGSNQGSFDANGYLLLGYSTSQGAYKLQVNGAAIFGGAVTGVTATAGDNSTKLATTAFVAAAVAASGVSSFNTRTGAVTLTSGDVTTALTYTPANLAGATFSGTVSGPTPATADNTTKLATTAYVQNNLSSYATTASLSSYATTASLANYAPLAGANFTGRVDVASTVRATGQSNPASGAGVELTFAAGVGYVTAYDRTAAGYKDINLAGSTVTFKVNGSNAGSFDANSSLLVGYATTNGATYKLQVNSQIWATSATIATSDARLKTNVVTMGSATAAVLALRPVKFDFIPHPVHNLPTNRQVGFIAQEVDDVLRDADFRECVVSTNDDGAENLKGLAEVKLIPLLVKTIQELEARIRVLENK